MNCDLWRSHGRIFARWTCLLFLVLVGRICVRHLYLKPKKNYFLCVKNLVFFSPRWCAAAWWSCCKVVRAVCPFCGRFVCCGYWSWFAFCRHFATNCSSCWRRWTTLRRSSRSSFFSSSSSGFWHTHTFAPDFTKEPTGNQQQPTVFRAPTDRCKRSFDDFDDWWLFIG